MSLPYAHAAPHLALIVDSDQRIWDVKTRRFGFRSELLAAVGPHLGRDAVLMEPDGAGGFVGFAIARVAGVDAAGAGDNRCVIRLGDMVDMRPRSTLSPDDLIATVGGGWVAGLAQLAPEAAARLRDAAGIRGQAAAAMADRQEGLAEARAAFEHRDLGALEPEPHPPARETVLAAVYDYRCAVSGMSTRSGTGRQWEAVGVPIDAEDIGPDLSCWLLLGATYARLYAMGLMAVSRDYRIQVKDALIDEGALRLLNPSGFLTLPRDESAWPDPDRLERHCQRWFLPDGLRGQ